MTSHPSSKWLIVLALICTASGLHLAGCGKQELYEPPGSPYRVVGSLRLFSDCEAVAVLDQHAFLAGGQAGLYVVDFSTPNRPVLLQTIPTDTESDALSLAVIRTLYGSSITDVVLLNEGTEGIHTFNVTDPDSCYSYDQGSTGFNVQSMHIEQADAATPVLVYVADSRSGIKVFEYLPESPGTLPPAAFHIGIDRRAMALAIRDGFAYVACDQLGLTEVDIRTLSLPEVTGWADTQGNALDIALKDDYAFVADGTEGLIVFNIKGGGDPTVVATLDLSGYSRSIVIRDNLACLASAGGGVHFVDITIPANPVYLGTVVTTYATDVAISTDGLILVSDRTDGLIVLGGSTQFTDLTPPAAVTNLAAEPYTTAHVNLAWLTPGDDGFQGKATTFDLRWSTAEIVDEASWSNANRVTGVPAPQASGTRQAWTVSDLPAETECYFALKVGDDAGNVSDLSNLAGATTYGGIVLVNPRVHPFVSTELGTSFTYRVDYNQQDDAPPTLANLIINGTQAYPLSLSSEPTDLPGLDTYVATVQLNDWGAYRYRFRCDDSFGHSFILPNVEGPYVGQIVFEMGSPANELGRKHDELLHRVIILHYVEPADSTEVTQAQWEQAGMTLPADIPEHFLHPQNPVVNISWYEAIEYCNRRSANDGYTPAYTVSGTDVIWQQDANGWRLPTEAEWEFLCRARTSTAFANGDITVELSRDSQDQPDPLLDRIGWYLGNAGYTLHKVVPHEKEPNGFGLFDMHGNVAEWCWDWHGPYPDTATIDPTGPESGIWRVVRGGHWDAYARDCRSAARGSHWPNSGEDYIGLRVVRTSSTRWP